jgi:hypothetical protein
MAAKKDEPTPEQAIRAVRIFGAINLVLGLYMVLEGLAAMSDINLPGLAAKATVGTLGFILIIVAWGSAAASGLGLILRMEWGRQLAVLWGKIIVWVLPISFGLSHGLSEFLSLTFLIIIGICLYGNIVAQNLGKPEFDVAFEGQ